MKKGFTLIEVIIATAVFALFSIGVYQGYFAVYAAIVSAREKAMAADIANAHFEIIKNLPYSSVGTVGGNPSGVVTASQNIVRDSISFAVTTTILNVDDPFDGLSGGADPIPADYKLVEVRVACASCKNFSTMIITGRVAPLNLESI